jgi:hypothetical protein
MNWPITTVRRRASATSIGTGRMAVDTTDVCFAWDVYNTLFGGSELGFLMVDRCICVVL